MKMTWIMLLIFVLAVVAWRIKGELAAVVFCNFCNRVLFILTLFPIVVLILTENSNKKACCLILFFLNFVGVVTFSALLAGHV